MLVAALEEQCGLSNADLRQRNISRPFPRREARRAEENADAEGVRPVSRADNTLVKVLARAFRWKRMLESGESIAEPLEREGIAHSNMTYVLRLTLLALDIVKSIGRAAGAEGQADVRAGAGSFAAGSTAVASC